MGRDLFAEGLGLFITCDFSVLKGGKLSGFLRGLVYCMSSTSRDDVGMLSRDVCCVTVIWYEGESKKVAFLFRDPGITVGIRLVALPSRWVAAIVASDPCMDGGVTWPRIRGGNFINAAIRILDADECVPTDT